MDPMTLIALSFGVQGASSLANGFAQSQALSAQGAYQKQQYDTNARLADLQAQDAISRGDKEAATIGKRAGQVIGAQRAGYAGQGVDVNQGSAADIQAETAGIAAVDEMTARNNAWREAWGYKVQATDLTGRGQMAAIAAQNESRNTLLTGGMKALSSGLEAGYYAKKG